VIIILTLSHPQTRWAWANISIT